MQPSELCSHSVCEQCWPHPTPSRAPVLVAIALMEHGMKYADAVEYIRE